VLKLLDILQRRDDRLLPVFFQMLEETDQAHIAEMLRENVLQQQQKQPQGDHILL